MTNDEKRIRQVMQLALARLHIEDGIALATVLAYAHAEIVAMVAVAFGGDVAKGCLEAAAKKVEGLPGRHDAELVLAVPQGRA